MADISKFKCYRFQGDGSIYYGEIAYQNLKNHNIVSRLSVYKLEFIMEERNILIVNLIIGKFLRWNG